MISKTILGFLFIFIIGSVEAQFIRPLANRESCNLTATELLRLEDVEKANTSRWLEIPISNPPILCVS